MILEDLIFEPFGIKCINCSRQVSVSFEDLQLNSEVACPACQISFFPNKEVDDLLQVIKLIEGTDTEKVRNNQR